MDVVEWKDPETGRLYKAMQDGDSHIVIGPPEDLMEWLKLPEPTATNLHNALYRRGVLTYKDVTTRQNMLAGALQEALNLDAQRLTEAFFILQKEGVT